jgi:hypothetical protein
VIKKKTKNASAVVKIRIVLKKSAKGMLKYFIPLASKPADRKYIPTINTVSEL